MTSTAKQIGGSVGILIPKSIAKDLGIKAGTPIHLTATENAIVLRPMVKRRTRRTLAEVTRAMRPSAYRRQASESNTGRPVGRETL